VLKGRGRRRSTTLGSVSRHAPVRRPKKVEELEKQDTQ
jgi:hypothetical protein